MHRPIVLASTSPYRKALLDRLGIPYEAHAPRYEEEHHLPLTPEALVVELACRKAASLAAAHPQALIVGADQAAVLDGEILQKPGTLERALTQLERLQGRTHLLLAGICLLDARTGRTETDLQTTRMHMRPLTGARIRAYLEQDQPFDCAGAYRVEGPGIALFSAMEGDDYTGIIGLPLTRLVTLLERLGLGTDAR